MQLDDMVLESLDLGCAHTLHIVDIGVHQRLDSLRGEVWPEDRLLDRVGGPIWVGTNNVRLDRLVLSVDDYLFPRRERSVKGVVATVHHNSVVIELFNLLDGGQTRLLLPVVLVEEGLADAQNWLSKGVTELDCGRNALVQLRVSKSLVDRFHL